MSNPKNLFKSETSIDLLVAEIERREGIQRDGRRQETELHNMINEQDKIIAQLHERINELLPRGFQQGRGPSESESMADKQRF